MGTTLIFILFRVVNKDTRVALKTIYISKLNQSITTLTANRSNISKCD